ncbi:hypothetical protein Ac2012v2_007876 [Leucoagaricus gongylophorus]
MPTLTGDQFHPIKAVITIAIGVIPIKIFWVNKRSYNVCTYPSRGAHLDGFLKPLTTRTGFPVSWLSYKHCESIFLPPIIGWDGLTRRAWLKWLPMD